MTTQDILRNHPDWMQQWDDPAVKQYYGGDENLYYHDKTYNTGTPEEQAWYRTQMQAGNDWGKMAKATGAAANGPAWTNTAKDGLVQGAERASAGGNTNQIQGSTQTGAFDTTGSTNQTQTQTGANSTTQTSANVGQTSGSQAQSGGSSFNNTTGVNDTLGLSSLITNQMGQAQANDATRNAFLGDVVNTGGAGFQKQVSSAANKALSGPGMQGVGVGAQGRVAGSAVEGVAMNNLNQRLNATQQLAGPTAQSTLVGAGTPLLSTTSSGSGTNFSNLLSNTLNQGMSTGTSDSTSLNIGNLVSNESNKGTSNASGMQVATGQVPENTQKSGGGCYVCTEYVYQSKMNAQDVHLAAAYKLNRMPVYGQSLLGYSLYGPWLARRVRNSATFARMFFPIASAVLREELRLSGRNIPARWFDTACHFCFHYGSSMIGFVAKLYGHNRITTSVTDADRLSGKQLWFPINERS